MITEIGAISSTHHTFGQDNASINESKRFLRALLDSNEFAPTGRPAKEETPKTVSEEEKKKLFEENLKLEARKTDYSALAEKIKELVGVRNIDVKFDRDTDTKIMIMKFVNKDTQDVLKQFPAEVSIKIAKMIAQLTSNGAITDAKV